MDPDQPAHPRSLIRIHAVRLPTLLKVEKLIANSMDPIEWIPWNYKQVIMFITCGSSHHHYTKIGRKYQKNLK
jgi:hypothetical protein